MGLPLAGHYIKTHALTFKREKIVVSFTLDGVDYLGDYHVKNVIFGRPPFCVVVGLCSGMACFNLYDVGAYLYF